MTRVVASVAAVAFTLLFGVSLSTPTETAVANGDTRTIHFYHTHTGESIDATYRVDGHYDAAVLRQLNHFLRDWRNNDETNMDPRLFDTLWEVYRTAGATQPIQIYSAYRSPETNAMLRRRSRAVAEHSQHMLGKAMDTMIPGFPMHLVREVGMRLQRGGVGWYPSANFVHLDVGGVRSWPRMSYDQLASLFPDGKTVHVAADGRTLPGYEAARLEIAARGAEAPPSQESGGFFAWLFGGWGSGSGQAHEDEEDRRTVVASARPAPAPVAAAPAPETVLAYAEPQSAPTRPVIEAEQIGAAPSPQSAKPIANAQPDTAAVEPRSAMPLPPRRPSELMAYVEPIMPLPPVRPVALSRAPSLSLAAATSRPAQPANGLDAIGSLITKTASGIPSLRHSRLSPVISQSGRTTGQALAFAPPDVVARDLSTLHATAAYGPRPIALRAARSAIATGSARSPSGSSAAVPAPQGPRLVGLRKAAHRMTEEAAL